MDGEKQMNTTDRQLLKLMNMLFSRKRLKLMKLINKCLMQFIIERSIQL
jgi:hypothetical protein